MTATIAANELLDIARLRLQAGELNAADNFACMVLEQQPAHAEASLVRGQIAIARHDRPAAIAHLQQARTDSANASPAFFTDLGNALRSLGSVQAARDAYQAALAIDPQFVKAWNNLGVLAQAQGWDDAAETAYLNALGIDDQLALVHNNYAALRQKRRDTDGAAKHFQRALAIDPRQAVSWKNYGSLLLETSHYREALGAFENAISLQTDYVEALSSAVFLQMHLLEWDSLAQRAAQLRQALSKHPQAPLPPFTYFALDGDPRAQKAVAQSWSGQYASPAVTPHAKHTHPRLRLGYLGADFFAHATSWLTAGLFKHHDRKQFEVIAYDYGRDDGSPLRAALIADFDQFNQIGDLSNQAIADQIRRDEIDILIDLKGWTRHSRCELLALRPAPVQIHYLAYPGTLGATWCDYLIADPVVVPDQALTHYTESVVRLPHCYQINDNARAIAAKPSRQAAGLPDSAFVFCCMNQHYKILPGMFDLWMQLLQAVPDSVLWLLEISTGNRQRLQAQATQRGITPHRLIFAGSLPQAQHLARLQLADLALDTLPCNSHTTASDALWAGVPLVTCMGDSFAGRVGASCLQAVGLPELITSSLQDYFTLAQAIAVDADRHARLKKKLQDHRNANALFDTQASVAALELAYLAIWRRHQDGLPPSHIDIELSDLATYRSQQ